MKPNKGMNKRSYGLIVLSFSLVLGGCSLMQVREDVETLQKSTVLVGIVSSSQSSKEFPVVVAAYSKRNSERTIAHYTTLHEPGPYELMVPEGTHNIIAFADENKNLVYDKGEPAGQILSAEQVSIPAGGVAGNLDIFITRQNYNKIDLPAGTGMPSKKYEGFHSTCPGAIIDIDDVKYSDEFGRKGLWESLEFFREIGGNVYFLEPYDPEKIPILFVHGAGGSPQNWRTFAEEIDRTKFQPWFYYYPSGSSIDSMSNLLFWKLQNLQAKYKFNELCITAHSMGGLVVRSFMVNYAQLFPSIHNFISISTPWGGEELAQIGVKYSPAVIPMWRDIQPGSDFLNSIYQKDMPPAVDYYLFFGHKGNRSLIRPNNDKTVTLASQLDQRSQRDAKMIYGFNEDHVSILSSEQVLSQYNAILAELYQKSEATDDIIGNRLFVDFSFDFPDDQPKPLLALYLRPVEEEREETWIYLSPEDNGREHGPFASGDYEVSLIAPAFIPKPTSTAIRIENASVPHVRFSMEPVGYIRGYIQMNAQTNTQAGSSNNPNAEIEIQSITLTGSGISRTLVPLEGGRTYDELYTQHYLSETDFTALGTFFFFDLPEGKYELSVNAKGYEAFSETYDVKLGEYRNTIVIDLKKESLKEPGLN